MGELGQIGVGLAGEGQYVFTDLAELNSVITEWTELRDRLAARVVRLGQAAGLVAPPADDVVSRGYTKATQESVLKAMDHCEQMRFYADGYVQKLAATRAQYSETETRTVANIQQSGEG